MCKPMHVYSVNSRHLLEVY